MRILAGCLALWLASLAGARAQVTVEVVPDQQQFLPGESLPIAVRVTNRSGQTLKLGADNQWLTVTVEARDGSVVKRLADPDVRGEFTLESSQRATRRLDLEPCFGFTRPGRYLVQASVRIAAWDKQFTSETVAFDIITGARLWVREFGVPGAATNTAPEVRRYILQQANYLKTNLKLYLQITDVNEGKIFRVLGLGPMVSFGRPEPQLDNRSNLHVLFQQNQRLCSYTVVNPDGEILVRQTYEVAGSRPRLHLNSEGRLVVSGGVRRPAEDDIPAPEAEAKSESPAPGAKLAAETNAVNAAKP